mgnify:CR=1 FL=1
MSVRSYIRLCRPKQWVKNMFVFLPLFFSGNLLNMSKVLGTTIAFVSFSLVASAIYCLNDLKDAEADRHHPTKRFRPIASGEVSSFGAISLMTLLVVSSITLMLLLPGSYILPTSAVVLAYFIMNVAYCLKLKRFALVDVVVISLGFVLRVVAGGVSTGIYISHWIILMTFLLALFLALSKRRDDVVIYKRTGVRMRHNIMRYNLEFMSQATTLVATVMLICYIMYTVSPEVIARFQSSLIYVTSLFVLTGILRYMQLTVVDSNTGSPTRTLLNDRFIQLCLLGWVLTFVAIIYL